MDLKVLVNRLIEYAPLAIACDWDTVGLIVEPTEPLTVKKVLLTNEFSEPVLDEAIKLGVNMIISYHPTIGHTNVNQGPSGAKRLTQSDWKQRRLIKCIENRIALYTPHTTWDSFDGGINDYILEAFKTIRVEPAMEIRSEQNPSGFDKNVKVNVSVGGARDKLVDSTKTLNGVKLISERDITGGNGDKQVEVEYLATGKGVVEVIGAIGAIDDQSKSLMSTLRIFDLEKPMLKNVGLGRLAWLEQPMKIRDIIEKMKQYLGMKTFRFALGNGKSMDDKVSTLAVGAGCSTGLLNNTNAEFIITGELGHHEILHEVHRGVSVIVTDHSNTERVFLEPFRQRFSRFLKQKYNEDGVEFIVSKVDRDPLEYI